MKKLIEEKKEQYLKLGNEIADLQDQALKKELPKYRKLVGTIWKTRNCYSCPQNESDYWTLYMKVVKVDNHGDVYVARIQIDKDGHLTVEPESYNFKAETFHERYEKATKREWNAIVKRSHKLLESL